MHYLEKKNQSEHYKHVEENLQMSADAKTKFRLKHRGKRPQKFMDTS